MFHAHCRHLGNLCERTEGRIGNWERGKNREGGSGCQVVKDPVPVSGVS